MMTDTTVRTVTASPAQALRAALKAAGYNARKVTVRDRGGSTHTSLHVTIRDASVSLSKVRAIAAPHEHVRRDPASGEILLGGNTYLDVEYVDALVAPIKESFAAKIAAVPEGTEVSLVGGFSARRVPRREATYPDEVELGGPGFDRDRRNIACTVPYAAERLAIAYLDATAQHGAVKVAA